MTTYQITVTADSVAEAADTLASALAAGTANLLQAHGPLTIRSLIGLETVSRAAEQSARVARAQEDGSVAYGTARSIGDLSANFLKGNEDVRDAYLRVTLNTGWEVFWKVSELAQEALSGMFAIYDWSRVNV